jgi:hypothetical protein
MVLAGVSICIPPGFAQSATLSIGSASAQPGTSVSVPLSYTTDSTPASGVMWTFGYATTDITAITVTAGSAATAADKSINCNTTGPGQYTCIAVGMNATTIPAGALATVSLAVSATTSATSTAIQILNVAAADATGSPVAAAGSSGTVMILRPVALSAVTCSPPSLTVSASSVCTVSLTAAAPSSGTVVSLGYVVSNASVTMPASVTVPAGSTTAQFTVRLDSATSSDTMQITAAAAGVTKTTTITISAPPAGDTAAPVISSVTITPGSTSAIVTWTTNEQASSRVEFGVSASSLTSVVNSAALTNSHSLTLSGLSSSTRYYYRVRSTDGAGNTATYPASEPNSFITTGATNTSGLFAHWQFSEGSGTTTVDATGNTNPGTIYGSGWAPGRNGNGLIFDGIDDYVSVWAFDVPGSAMTISAWFKADALQNPDPRIISKASGAAEQDHYFMLSTTVVSGAGRLRFRLKTGGTTKTLIASSGDIPTGQWVHAVARYNGSRMTLYLNGVQVGSLAATGAMTGNSNVPVAIGRNPQPYAAFDGTIDEIRIYTRALNTNEIRSLHASGN